VRSQALREERGRRTLAFELKSATVPRVSKGFWNALDDISPDEAIAEGLVAQAASTELPEESKTELKRIIEDRLSNEIKQAEIDAGITRDYTHLGAEDFLKKQGKKIRELLCDGQGHLKNKYRKWTTLGEGDVREMFIALSCDILDILPITVPAIALYLSLYLIRVGLEKYCECNTN